METSGSTGKAQKIITALVFLSLLGSAVFTLVRFFAAPETMENVQVGNHTSTKSDYMLMVVQCLLGMAAMLLPGWLSRKWRIQIPSVMMMFYVLFLYAAIYLGEVKSFYYLIPRWDVILHGFSGFMLGCLSFSLISLLNKADGVPVNLTPAFVAVFAFSFSVMLGAVWEIYEYLMDGVMSMNMQKFILADGTVLSGHAALGDTMKDLMVDAVGALATSLVGYVSLRYDKGWIEKFQIHTRRENRP